MIFSSIYASTYLNAVDAGFIKEKLEALDDVVKYVTGASVDELNFTLPHQSSVITINDPYFLKSGSELGPFLISSKNLTVSFNVDNLLKLNYVFRSPFPAEDFSNPKNSLWRKQLVELLHCHIKTDDLSIFHDGESYVGHIWDIYLCLKVEKIYGPDPHVSGQGGKAANRDCVAFGRYLKNTSGLWEYSGITTDNNCEAKKIDAQIKKVIPRKELKEQLKRCNLSPFNWFGIL